jgi:hypothetical protein
LSSGVPDPWLPWVVLRPSRLQRRLAALALLTTVTTSALLVLAALSAQTIAGFAAATLAVAAAGAAFAAWRRSSRQPQALRIDAEGRIATRRGDETATAEPVFVSPWLICLRIGPRRVVPVWRDGLDDIGYRRLAAAGRWRQRRTPELDGISDRIG